MTCDQYRLAISALVDGEAAGMPLAEVEHHLGQCASCARFRSRADALRRQVRLTSAPAVPDLTAAVLGAIGATEPARRELPTLRLALVAIAVVQLVAAVPALVLGEDAGLPVHTARHLGSFSAALAIGFLVVAWKPERVAGVLPVAAALVVCLLATSVLDVSDGRTAAFGELGHATELAGVVFVWLVGRRDPGLPVRLQATA